MKEQILQNLVLPALKPDHIRPFPFSGKTRIVFEYTTPQFSIYWQVTDHPKQQLLAIESSGLVTVPPGASGILILARLNETNAACVGKFTLADEKRIVYCLELPYTAETTQAMVQHALNLAFDTVVTQYEGLRKAAKASSVSEGEFDKRLFDRIKEAFGEQKTSERRVTV